MRDAPIEVRVALVSVWGAILVGVYGASMLLKVTYWQASHHDISERRQVYGELLESIYPQEKSMVLMFDVNRCSEAEGSKQEWTENEFENLYDYVKGNNTAALRKTLGLLVKAQLYTPKHSELWDSMDFFIIVIEQPGGAMKVALHNMKLVSRPYGDREICDEARSAWKQYLIMQKSGMRRDISRAVNIR